MEFVKIATGEPIYPYSLQTLRAENPETAFSAEPSAASLAEYDVFPVEEVTQPAIDPGEVIEGGVEKVGGVWRQKWTVRAMTADEFTTAKQAKWEQAKANRDAAIDAGCTVPGVGTFDTDLLSRTNIHGAVTAATIASGQSLPFSVPWKLQDNSLVTLDAPTMIAAGMAVMQRTSDCHAHAQSLGIAIEAAETFADLASIDIETDWPA